MCHSPGELRFAAQVVGAVLHPIARCVSSSPLARALVNVRIFLLPSSCGISLFGLALALVLVRAGQRGNCFMHHAAASSASERSRVGSLSSVSETHANENLLMRTWRALPTSTGTRFAAAAAATMVEPLRHR